MGFGGNLGRSYANGKIGGAMPRLRSLPEQPVMRDLYRAYPATSKPLAEFTEGAMRGPPPLTQAQRKLIVAFARNGLCDDASAAR